MRASSALTCRPGRAILLHDSEHPAPARIEGPLPELPGGLPLPDRKENHLCAANEILEWHISHAPLVGRNTTVCRIVTVITHHKIVSGRNLEDLGVAVNSAVALKLD